MDGESATKHEAVLAWLGKCPYIRDLFFQYARARPGDVALNPMTAHRDVETRAFTGASERRYECALIRYAALSDAPNSTDNVSSLLDAEHIAEWIDQCDEKRDYPKFPAGCTITEVGVFAPSAGFFAAQDENVAKYVLEFYIDYLAEDAPARASAEPDAKEEP